LNRKSYATLKITAEAPIFYHSTSCSPLAEQFFPVQGLKTRDTCTSRPND